MLRLVLLADRLVTLLRALAAMVICGVGAWYFAGEVSDSYSIEEWLVWKLLPIWGYTLLLNAACVAGGAGVIDLLFRRRSLPALEWLVLSMAVGFVLFVLGMYAAGAVCSLKTATAWLLPVLLLAFGFRGAWRLLHALSQEALPRMSLVARAAAFMAVGFGAVCLALMYLEALHTNAFNFDASWYHYPVAQDYARTGCLIPFPGDHHRTYPHLTSIVHTWALLVPGLEPLPTRWMLSLHLEYSIVVWRIVGVAAAIRWMLYDKRIPGVWAVFFLFPSIFIYDQSIGGSADHFLGVFAVPVALALARTLRRFEWRWAVVLGIVMGGHVLTKYQALYLLAGVTLMFALRWAYVLVLHFWRGRRGPRQQQRLRQRRLLLGPAVAIGAALLVTAPHFVKNAVFYNNPFYPFARTVFTGSWPNDDMQVAKSVESQDDDDDQAGDSEVTGRPKPAPAPTVAPKKPSGKPSPFRPRYEGIRRQIWAASEVYEYSFFTRNRAFTNYRPYMGALFSLLLPCLLFVRRGRRIWYFSALGFLAFMVWANTRPNDRYLLSFYDLFIASAGALMVRAWQLGMIARLGLVPLVALQLFWGGDAMLFYGAKRLREALSLIAEGYAGKSIESRLAAQSAQQKITAATPPDAVILARNYKGLLGLNRSVYMDIRGAQYYVNYDKIRDANELWTYLRKRDVTHLLYPEGQRAPARLNNTVLFADLFQSGCEKPQKFSALRLCTLADQPPPPSAPTLVLVRKMRGYRDGVYRVEQLDVDRSKSAAQQPKPVEPYVEGDAAILEGVRAVVLGMGSQLSGQAEAELQRSFDDFERFKEYALYLRKLE